MPYEVAYGFIEDMMRCLLERIRMHPVGIEDESDETSWFIIAEHRGGCRGGRGTGGQIAMQQSTGCWDYRSSRLRTRHRPRRTKRSWPSGGNSAFCDVRAIVVADPGGKRIGSGGSTLYCLMEVLHKRLGRDVAKSGPRRWEEVLAGLRILIVHAGGDSRRLPAYGPCGKIFIPVPGENDSAVCLTLFDRQLPTYLSLPGPAPGQGQTVIVSGDVLLRFDPSDICLTRPGITGLACYASPEQASRHGVFCQRPTNAEGGDDSSVCLYLQKPSIAEQRARGAIDAYGQSCLDIGVMHFDAATATRLLRVFGARPDAAGRPALAGRRGRAVLDRGLDFYREVCCAMGTQASLESYIHSAKDSGSRWTDAMLAELFETLSDMPFSVQLLKHCDFLDFGASRAILTNGTRLLQEDRGISSPQSCPDINNEVAPSASVQGSRGCGGMPDRLVADA